ncbi:BA14K family protein [uncultured Cohaesibacter sp.]|uniref:BA14K family protein n=1 Tax=uncultured Cohaesibacter sp. TaxID=1002546 RepID=UPI002AA7BDEE|nr:BA14K family protein [uncultured Cohaesibacter sp.]
MKLLRTIMASAIALCMGLTGLPLGNVNASLGVVGVSDAQAQPAPRYRDWHRRYPHHRRPPERHRHHHHKHNNNNVGAGVAGAIIGLAVGAIAADALSKNSNRNRAPEWCNVRACSSRYRSFRAYDCSFQPYNGPRRYCRM